MKKLLLLFILFPIILLAGDPIPGIDIKVEQSPNGISKSGKTNGRGEFIATGLKEGNYIVTLEMNGVRCVIGDQVNEKITIPSSKSTVSIKPIRLELSSKSMFLSKKGYDYYASSSREAGSGMATGKRQHKPMTITKEVDKSSTKSATMDNGNGENCDGEVEITPMKGGELKIKVVCKK